MKEVVSRDAYHQRYFKTAVLSSSLIVFVFVFVFLGFKPAFSMDMTRAQAIADKLERLTGKNIQNIKIAVENSAKPDAYLHPMGYIVITTGLMNFCEDDAEMAFILGHELAHFLRGHYKEKAEALGFSKDISVPEQLIKEVDADLYGLQYMKAAGYEPAASLRVLNKLIAHAHGAGQSSSLQKRINALTSSINN